MFEAILCAVDFSAASRQALRVALDLARRTSDPVLVLHAIEPLLAEGATAAGMDDQLKADLSSELTKLAAAEGRVAPGVRLETLLKVGEPYKAVLDAAAARRAGLIVMGSRGAGGLRKAVLGSSTERVLRDSPVPVLVVPGGAGDVPAFAGFDAVHAAVEFDDARDEIVRTASSLASLLGVPLTLVHAVAPITSLPQYTDAIEAAQAARAATAREKLDELAASLRSTVPVRTEVRTGAAAEQLAEVTAVSRGLLVLGAGGGGLFHRTGSTAYRVFSLAAAPVLAVPRLPGVRS